MSTRLAEEVLQEARDDIRSAIDAALKKIKKETGLNPSAISIRVQMLWTGPMSNSTEEENVLGAVHIEFHV